jgi:hypothetical protein
MKCLGCRRIFAAELEYVYDVRKINLAGTSGAPILNAIGEIVALNIGGDDDGGRLAGFGNPCTSILKFLKSAR